MADFTTPYTARSRPPVSSGSTASSLTSPPDSLLQDPESQSVSSPPSSPLTSIPPSEISDCEWDDNAIANGVDRSGLGFDASATTSTSSRRRSPPSSPSPSSAPSPPRRRSRPLHLKQSVMPPSSPSSSKSTNAVGQETMFLFGHPVPKATVQNRAKARVGSLLKASQIERAQVEQPQREQSTVDRSLSDQPFVKHSIVAQQASRAKQQPISSLSPPTLSGDTAADNNPTRPRITNSLKDLGKIPKKAVMVEDLFTDGIPRSGPEGAAGTVAERLSTQNRVPIVYRTPAPIYETHTGTNASPIAAAMHSGPSVLGQQASSIMSSTVYPPKEWEWSEDERQALREKLQQRNRDDEVEQRTTEPDEPPPANVLVAPVRPRNAFRRTSSSKRKREEEPEESQPVESPLKKARMDGKGELEIESPRWTGWVNYPLPGNLMFTKRSTAKARPSAAARWTNGFGAAFNGRKLTNRAIRSLPPPHSSPPISFHSWTDLSESAAYGRLRCGVQMGSRDVTGLTATALVLEGPAGPDSSWEDTTLTITMKRSLSFPPRKGRTSNPQDGGSEKSTPVDRQLSTDQAGLLNTWYSEDPVDIVVKSDFSLLPFRLDTDSYALLGSYTIKEVLKVPERAEDKHSMLKVVFEWDQRANGCPPWWLSPGDSQRLPSASLQDPLPVSDQNPDRQFAVNVRRYYDNLDPSTTSAPSLHTADMAAVLFGTAVCQHCGIHASRARLGPWSCTACGRLIGVWQFSPDWRLPVEVTVSGATLQLPMVQDAKTMIEGGRILGDAALLGRSSWKAEEVKSDSEGPDEVLRSFIEGPLPMLRVPLSGRALEFISKQKTTPWFIHTSTWSRHLASERDEVQTWNTALPAASKAMNFLNRIVASGEGVTLFSSMTTVLSSEGRDCKFVVRPDDEIGLLALRSTVVVKVALRNPPKRVKDPLKPKVKKTQVKVDEDGNYFRIEVEPTEENVVLTVVPESETSEMEAILATSAATAEEPADSTPSPSQADNVSGVRGPHSKTVPVFRKTTVRIRKTAEKPKPKRMKSLKEKVTAGARAKILRETAQDKKAKWIIQKGSIINSMKKGRALPKKAKVKVIKPVKERKPKASGASTRDPPLLLQHGDRVLLSATEEIIVTLQWKACGFICIGTRDDPPDHVRPTAMSVAPESPIDEFESEEDQASSVVLDDKEMTGLDLDRPDTGALSDDPTVIPTAESTNGLAAPQSLEEGRATLNEAAADENLTEAEIDEQSGDEDREIDMDISDCDGSSDLDFERSTQPVLPIPPEQESTFGVRGPDFHFVRSSPVSNGSMYLKGQCLPTAFDLCRTKFATDEEQNESHATPADSSIRPAQLTTSQPDALPETLPSVVDDMLLDDDERMEVDDAAPASVLDGASGILDDMSRIARDPSSEDFVDDLLLSGVGSDAILPTPLSTSTDNNSPQRALQSE